MKRIIQILVACLVINFVAVTAIVLINNNLPELLPATVLQYRICSILRLSLEFFPATLLTGFLIGCVVTFGNNPGGSQLRFSPSMFRRYTMVIVISLVMVGLLVISNEIVRPILNETIATLEERPKILNEFRTLARRYYEEGDYTRAFYYIKSARDAVPGDEELEGLYHDYSESMFAQRTIRQRVASHELVEVQRAVGREVTESDLSWTVSDLLKKAKEASEDDRLIDAHYYARLALKLCREGDPMIAYARDIVNQSWNALEHAAPIGDERQIYIWNKKKEGYEALASEDYIKAYYIFTDLSNISEDLRDDPDVKHYLDMAQDKMDNAYFFTDEVSDIRQLETSSNIYFSVRRPMDKTDVVFIRGMSMEKKGGRLVRYLRDVTVYTYDKEHNLERYWTVPYAKLLAESTQIFSSEHKALLGIKDSYEHVPYMLLVSVDRDVEGVRIEPVTSYYTKEVYGDDRLKNYVFPMPYDDIVMITQASRGAANMSLWDLLHFTPRTQSYGYSPSIYYEELLRRVSAPLVDLTLMVFVAVMAWNYRTSKGQLFKFKWVLVIPCFAGLIYIALSFIRYMCTLLNCVLISTTGQWALPSAVGLFVVFFIGVSVMFLARRARGD